MSRHRLTLLLALAVVGLSTAACSDTTAPNPGLEPDLSETQGSNTRTVRPSTSETQGSNT